MDWDVHLQSRPILLAFQAVQLANSAAVGLNRLRISCSLTRPHMITFSRSFANKRVHWSAVYCIHCLR
jgi:hypothetical protein